MSWFASLFSSGSSRRKNQAMTSTHDAFTLPTSSPGFNQPDGFQASTPTPDPESATGSYTYPPQSAASPYDFMPSSSNSRARPASLLPLHHSPLPPLPPYPPLSQTWNRLRQWLSDEYPELGDTLNWGVLPQDLAQIEMHFGFELPAPIRESYLITDGQEPESSAGCSEGLFFGLTLLPLEDVLEEWRFWREVDDDPATGANAKLREVMQSIPPGYIRKAYSSRGWIPLISDKTGNYLGVDLSPGEAGAPGQVIVFGRDFDTKVVMWRGDGPGGWAKWLLSFVEELESGEGFELGVTTESEGSEDDVGYESYFYDGSGRGQGDGGGATGTSGLRLIGEYRGWSVLEAWADRSVRKWEEAGLAPDLSSLPQEKGKAPEHLPVESLDLSAMGKISDALVPMPVVAEVEPEPVLVAPFNNVTNQSGPKPPRSAVPTISVTKPPAPLPVLLPTEVDIDSPPSSPDTESSLDVDLEAGSGILMREVELTQERTPSASATVYAPPVIGSTFVSGAGEATLVPLPISPPQQTPTGLVQGTTAPATAMTDITDLLVEPALPLAPPIQPSSPPSASSLNGVYVDIPAATPTPLPDSSPETRALEPAQIVDATSIRLVGGGGVVGISEELNGEESTDTPGDFASDAAEVSSISSQPTEPTPAIKHDKKKSITSGFKRISQLGGKRRKDSSSSLKDAK
ncbi:hypothetical protein JAAARDRAFT_31662 [Jaapia argillacea MUCL 33604]|uniref:Knr4/Smi1-like domain-containing protein n=1 Tax=Jaapia argillacea MUCL 33604 TaxID=933084 RepID=A0A067Q0T0_9AGAM|nr:hypothetical protein JAAARDRAFT_31662 [Jaapia argillacea MUCL 33604]